MNSETKNCQNCKKDFTIEPDDFSFYEKMKVPTPTFCPSCRLQRRMMFRNERTLYKGICAKCNKSVITIFNPESGLRIYCGPCWWGDSWDATEYAQDYIASENFFLQLRNLMEKTPFMNLVTGYSTLVNSEYINHAATAKNCYLIFNADFCENVYYSTIVNHVKDSADCYMMNKTELSYGSIGGDGSRVFFSENCPESVNVWYSKDCVGCTDCFGCVNLRNKSNCIYNEPYSKEEYIAKIKSLELDKYSSHLKIAKSIYDFWNKFPRRYMYGRMNVNSTGEYVYASKNVKDGFMVATAEDSKYCQMITLPPFKDCSDITEWGMGAEMCVEGVTVGEGAYQVKYCSAVWNNVRNVEYSLYVVNCSNCFGCVNLRNKEYCIFNKQYTKEEYFILRERIIADLEKHPYVDIKGRVFKYGEFLPYDISPFAYNESFVNNFYPLSKDEAKDQGFKWIEQSKSQNIPTLKFEEIPDSIVDIPDDFTKEILECDKCVKPYRIAQGELNLLRRFSIPVPRSCPDCRHLARIQRINKPFFYDRVCDKCGIDIKTSFAPDRQEIIYCEKCYQQEVY